MLPDPSAVKKTLPSRDCKGAVLFAPYLLPSLIHNLLGLPEAVLNLDPHDVA
jgi:hypothetical protein